jgi:hypothetical protein
MKWRGKKPYVAVIVGTESGAIIPLRFIDFDTELEARRWLERMKDTQRPPIHTRFEYRPLSDFE